MSKIKQIYDISSMWMISRKRVKNPAFIKSWLFSNIYALISKNLLIITKIVIHNFDKAD